MKNNNTNYQVGDFLITLKNAAMARNKEVKVASAKKILAMAEGMKKLGYVDAVKKSKDGLTVSLTFKNKKPRLLDIKLVSKPGLRVYKSILEIEKKKGPSTYLISSPKGIVSTKEAVKLRTGGEVLAEIW